MVNVEILRNKVKEKGMNVEELAKAIAIDRSTLYRKLQKKGEDFSIKEANLIVQKLELSKNEAVEIFFS